MRSAFVFPGQGSQSVGMLAELAHASGIIEETFAEASGALGHDLWRLTQAGPPEELNRTEHTQPAMLAAGVATYRLWRQAGGNDPNMVCGHSLGEFTALVCAQSLDFAEAIKLVAFRARAMQEAVPLGTGAMAAILGLQDAQVLAACASAAGEAVVEPVNFNAPGQVVIAGERAAVQRAMEAASGYGAKRVMLLPVSVPAHSSLMEPAAERLAERLTDMRINAPSITFVSGVDAAPHGKPEDIRSLLARQLARPVLWSAAVRALLSTGVQALIECGPGKVLTGLNRRIERRADVAFIALEDPTALHAALEACGGASHA